MNWVTVISKLAGSAVSLVKAYKVLDSLGVIDKIKNKFQRKKP